MPAGFVIKEFPFDSAHRCVPGLESHPKGKNWPVVYMIHNDKELYVGETSSAFYRMNQHLEDVNRKNLKHVRIIFDHEYNKSAILDIEQSLIHLFSVDGKYSLQNRNGGQSKKHDYYQREKYLNKIDEIWDRLHNLGMTYKTILDIRNSDSYKYSPYNSLNEEQNAVCLSTINDILDNLLAEEQGITIIQGSAGTGKSVVLMNMIFQLVNCQTINVSESEEDDELSDYQNIQRKLRRYLLEHNKSELKIAYVIAMTSFRVTIQQVFKITGHGLKSNMVIGPTNIIKDDLDNKYDVLFVDEAHRLARRKNISYMGPFDNKCKELLGEECDVTKCTQLDWILAGSKNVVLIYDDGQRVAGSDITNAQFWSTINNTNFKIEKKYLVTQMRCLGGVEFSNYLKTILACENPERLAVNNYDFKLFENIEDLILNIHEKEDEYQLCRVVAGYSWEWKSKGIHSVEEILRQEKQDIEIEGHKYIWNMTDKAWILSNNAVNEIGCIHTTQGYDLNYVGVIFGREIDYNPTTNEIVVYRDLFFDKKARNGSTPESLKQYIINAYTTIMLRGIRGCYVYAFNKNLRDYLNRFIDSYSASTILEKPNTVPNIDLSNTDKPWLKKLKESQRRLGINTDNEDKNSGNSRIYTFCANENQSLLHKTCIPFFDIKVACGGLESGESILDMTRRAKEDGWVEATEIGVNTNEGMFIVRAKGNSMLPKIHPGDLCLFKKYTGGSRNGEIVLARQKDFDSDYGCNFTMKKYFSEKKINPDGTWEHSKIELRPLNDEYPIIKINSEVGVDVLAILVKVI